MKSQMRGGALALRDLTAAEVIPPTIMYDIVLGFRTSSCIHELPARCTRSPCRYLSVVIHDSMTYLSSAVCVSPRPQLAVDHDCTVDPKRKCVS